MTPERTWPYELLCWASTIALFLWHRFFPTSGVVAGRIQGIAWLVPLLVLFNITGFGQGYVRSTSVFDAIILGVPMVLMLATRLWPEKIPWETSESKPRS